MRFFPLCRALVTKQSQGLEQHPTECAAMSYSVASRVNRHIHDIAFTASNPHILSLKIRQWAANYLYSFDLSIPLR